MSLKHKVSICVNRSDGRQQTVLKSGSCTLRSRFLNLLFGSKVGVLVLTPGDTVESVEIKEIGGNQDVKTQ
jgi:hypothetical protein